MRSSQFPIIEQVRFDVFGKSLLILSEGFEARSLSFIAQCSSIKFDKILVCKYYPHKKSMQDELLDIIFKTQPSAIVSEFEYNRYEPFSFESSLISELENVNSYTDVVIDISVMSKYMIMQIICALINFTGKLKIVYTEPASYAPSEEEFMSLRATQQLATTLPSYGVHDIVRTPLLTSLVMQKSPTLLVAFLSFNEQLIRALLSECSPTHLYLINGIPAAGWREKAMLEIHAKIIDEFKWDNKFNPDGTLQRRTSSLFYFETFDLLADIYKKHCVKNRIVLAPTGSKMQALACALFKLCCSDVHIEYPTPESYYVEGYSSSQIKKIYQVSFSNLGEFIRDISEGYGLNG